MDLSFGEYNKLVAKAFRGAGYSWGLAEDAAFAARRLAEFDLGSGDVVVRLLTAVDDMALADRMPDAEWRSSGGALCPVCVGTSIADHGGCEELTVGALFEPLLLAPFLEMVSTDDVSYVIDWPAGRCEVAVDTIAATSEGHEQDQAAPAAAAQITITPRDADTGSGQEPVRAERVLLRPEVQTTLEDFAHRVYAPATEESRRAGAGE